MKINENLIFHSNISYFSRNASNVIDFCNFLRMEVYNWRVVKREGFLSGLFYFVHRKVVTRPKVNNSTIKSHFPLIIADWVAK